MLNILHSINSGYALNLNMKGIYSRVDNKISQPEVLTFPPIVRMKVPKKKNPQGYPYSERLEVNIFACGHNDIQSQLMSYLEGA